MGRYLKLQRELSALARRHDAAARRAYAREWHQKIAAAGQSQRAAERYQHEKAELNNGIGGKSGQDGKSGKGGKGGGGRRRGR
ncbi:hypothetical protein ABIB26_003358 [Arthrobacter sp. UYEF20]